MGRAREKVKAGLAVYSVARNANECRCNPTMANLPWCNDDYTRQFIVISTIFRPFDVLMTYLCSTFAFQGIIIGTVFLKVADNTAAFFSRSGVLYLFVIYFPLLSSGAHVYPKCPPLLCFDGHV
jgi:hypothetical protein